MSEAIDKCSVVWSHSIQMNNMKYHKRNQRGFNGKGFANVKSCTVLSQIKDRHDVDDREQALTDYD